MMAIPGSKVNLNLLNRLGYIENSSQAHLYLLDKRFIDWVAMQKEHNRQNLVAENYLSQLRKKFPHVCDMAKKDCQEVRKKWDEYDNALYGYMMWNLGDTKIFCPENIDFPKESKESSKKFKSESRKCLKIKGEYLHLLPES